MDREANRRKKTTAKTNKRSGASSSRLGLGKQHKASAGQSAGSGAGAGSKRSKRKHER